MLFEASVKILIFICLLTGLQTLLIGFGLLGGGIIIHDTHVVNAVHYLHLEVSNEDIHLQIYLVLQKGPFELVLPYMHVVNCLYFGVIMHVRGGEGIACKVGNPIMEIVVTR